MNGLTRRRFAQLTLGTAVTTLAAPHILRAQAKPRAVVIGGGAGGATAARYIAKDSEGAIDVTLIEPNKTFTTCFFSNLYLGGFRTFDSITHSYSRLESGYGIKIVHQMATAIDRDAKEVMLADGSKVPYDRLVVSPGIDLIYDSVPGYSQEAAQIAPHAWKAGPQTLLLKNKLDAVENGQQIVMVAPPNPYRCPPGPYERVSMMAHILKSKGLTDAKIIVLDPKPKFSKQALFQEGWMKYYPGMVEWLPPSVMDGIKEVNVDAMTFKTGLDTFKADAASIIPAQKAGSIAQKAGLTNSSGWCPIVPKTMQSTIDENIHVIGDSSVASAMPKSGFAANSQAKVAAMAVRGALTGSRTFSPRFANTCWSLIAPNDGVKVGATYKAGEKKIEPTSTFISKNGETAALRKQTYEESVGWYDGITNDIFG